MERPNIFQDEYSSPLSRLEKKATANEIFSGYEIKEPIGITKTFVILTGIPGSGKSTVASYLSEKYGFNQVATDSIKLFLLARGQKFAKSDLFNIQTNLFKKLLKRELNVISDSNSALSVHRQKLKRLAQEYNHKSYNIYIKCDPEICFHRVISRDHVVEQDMRDRWHRKIIKYFSELQIPRNSIVVDGDKTQEEIQKKLESAIK